MKIFAIILGVAVIGGGVWFMRSSSKVSETAPVNTVASTEQQVAKENTVSEADKAKTANSPEELAKKGGQFKCTFDITDPNTSSSGTVYIDGKKFRGDFKSVVKAVSMTIESHAISDAAYVYAWTSASPTGYKMPITDEKGSSIAGALSGSFGANGANANWNCAAEKFSNDKFALPTGIKFTEAAAKK